MSHPKNKVDWCLKKAEKELLEGRTHRGLRKVEPNLAKAREHILKSEHNIKVTAYLKEGGYTDWCSSSIFYVIYHCFLSILIKEGYESRNQECTFAYIASLIEDQKILITSQELSKISSLDISKTQESARTITDLREEYQYSTKLSLKDNEYDKLLSLAKQILHKTKTHIEQ